VKCAVGLLHDHYEGEVSRTVIRIRLAEVGLAPAFSRQQQDQAKAGFVRIGDLLPDAVSRLFEPGTETTEPDTVEVGVAESGGEG
jgi:hypothetical protein